MRAVIMYAPRRRPGRGARATRPSSSRPTRSSGCRRDLHLRVRPVALPRRRPVDHHADGPRVRRRRRGDRRRGEEHQGRRLRRRLVLRLRQHLRDLPGRLPVPLRPPSSPGAPIGTQAEYARIPLADGTLVATPGMPDADLIPSLLAASDVLGTGWFAAVAAEAGPARPSPSSATARSACSACSPPSSSARSGSSPCPATPTGRRSPASSAPPTSSRSAATRASPAIKELTGGLGAHCVIEAVGTQESMMQAIRSTRAGGHVGYVGVSHDVRSPASSCSSPASTCTAAPPPCAGSCPS